MATEDKTALQQQMNDAFVERIKASPSYLWSLQIPIDQPGVDTPGDDCVSGNTSETFSTGSHWFSQESEARSRPTAFENCIINTSENLSDPSENSCSAPENIRKNLEAWNAATGACIEMPKSENCGHQSEDCCPMSAEFSQNSDAWSTAPVPFPVKFSHSPENVCSRTEHFSKNLKSASPISKKLRHAHGYPTSENLENSENFSHVSETFSNSPETFRHFPEVDSQIQPTVTMTDNLNESMEENSSEVEFRVGKDRQLMLGTRIGLEAVSPVFKSLLGQRKKQTVVEIPDIRTQSFGVILRCAAQDNDLQLTPDTVWHVLYAADRYQVGQVVTRCFHYLLHSHPHRRHPRHLCTVLEKAHQLNYPHHQHKCLHRIKRLARKILTSTSGLAELCHGCILDLVMADDLNVPEILVHDAVVTWARAVCKKRGNDAEPTWEDLRATAGQLVYHVRYLTMPRTTLESLRTGDPFCLLSEKEKRCLLEGDTASFPPQVGCKRSCKELKMLRDLALRLKDKKTFIFSIFACILMLLVVFLMVCFFFPGDSMEGPPETDAVNYVLVIQEEQY